MNQSNSMIKTGVSFVVFLLAAFIACSQSKPAAERSIQLDAQSTITAITNMTSSGNTDSIFSEIARVGDDADSYNMTWKLIRFNEDVNGNKFADGTETFNIAPLPFRLQKRNGHFIMKDRQGGSGLSDMIYDAGELILFDAFLVPAVGLVKAGASWTDSIKGGRSSSVNSYTIDKITGNIASISYSGTFNQKADIDNRGTMMRVETERKCSGVIQLSLQTFLVLSKTRDGEDTITLDFMGNKQTNSSSFRMVTRFGIK